jgi:hypothetical protein
VLSSTIDFCIEMLLLQSTSQLPFSLPSLSTSISFSSPTDTTTLLSFPSLSLLSCHSIPPCTPALHLPRCEIACRGPAPEFLNIESLGSVAWGIVAICLSHGKHKPSTNRSCRTAARNPQIVRRSKASLGLSRGQHRIARTKYRLGMHRRGPELLSTTT